MKKGSLLFLIIPITLFGCFGQKDKDWLNEPITEIIVSDSQHKTVSTTNEQFDIDMIKYLLSESKALGKKEEISVNWDYFIDIKTEQSSQRWHYSSQTGLFTMLSHAKKPINKIPNYRVLNKVWEIGNATPNFPVLKIFYYRKIEGNPQKTITIRDTDTINEIRELYSKLPKEGNIFKKISSSSEKIEVLFLEEDETEILMIKIFGNSVQYENTAFDDGVFQKEEKAFVEKVKELLDAK